MTGFEPVCPYWPAFWVPCVFLFHHISKNRRERDLNPRTVSPANCFQDSDLGLPDSRQNRDSGNRTHTHVPYCWFWISPVCLFRHIPKKYLWRDSNSQYASMQSPILSRVTLPFVHRGITCSQPDSNGYGFSPSGFKPDASASSTMGAKSVGLDSNQRCFSCHGFTDRFPRRWVTYRKRKRPPFLCPATSERRPLFPVMTLYKRNYSITSALLFLFFAWQTNLYTYTEIKKANMKNREQTALPSWHPAPFFLIFVLYHTIQKSAIQLQIE